MVIASGVVDDIYPQISIPIDIDEAGTYFVYGTCRDGKPYCRVECVNESGVASYMPWSEGLSEDSGKFELAENCRITKLQVLIHPSCFPVGSSVHGESRACIVRVL